MHKVLIVQNDLLKMANNEIRNRFFDLLNQFINNEVAEDYKNSILENSLYRYAVDNNARINFLNTLKEYDTLPHWNPYSVKGVIYQNGNVELIESEINDLINEYRVNLSNIEFENELDKDKPPGLKSCNRLIMAVNDCLEIQIINEMIRELSFSKSTEIFKDNLSKEFFEYIFYEFISKDKYPKTAVQYAFRQFFDTGKSINLIEMDYSINKGESLPFSEYYNDFIKDKIPKEKFKDWKIEISLNKPTLQTLSEIGNLDKRKEKFNSLLLEFQKNNKQ